MSRRDELASPSFRPNEMGASIPSGGLTIREHVQLAFAIRILGLFAKEDPPGWPTPSELMDFVDDYSGPLLTRFETP